jgi:molybdopterin synthase catalytic subunit
MPSLFELSDQPIDPDALRARLLDPACGACVTFEGWVRNHNEGREVASLYYEAYSTVARSEGEKVLAEAIAHFGIHTACCVHRVGQLQLADMAVWVGVSAGHRREAFDACSYIIDEIKKRVPIWKKEEYVGGDTGWVNTGAKEKY